MVFGWLGYTSLRRDLIAPTGAVDQYYTILPDLHAYTGNHVHWFPLKHAKEGCDVPNYALAESDEILAHQSVINYGDAFKPLMQHVNSAPTKGRFDALDQNPFDWSTLKYQLPHIDILIVEASGMMGAIFGINEVIRQLHRINPNLGIIIFDQDVAAMSVRSKMRKWLPDCERRFIVATHYLSQRFENQIVALSPHLAYRERQDLILDRDEVCYVGNDYKRRDQMLQFMTDKKNFWYGKLKQSEDFAPRIRQQCTYMGPWEPKPGEAIEDVYRKHGYGLNILRDDCYVKQLVAVRPSEITRSGCLMFMDKRLGIGKTLAGEWCCCGSGEEIRQKIDWLQREGKQFQSDMIQFQRQSVGYYTSRERYAQAIITAAHELMRGPVSNYKLNIYDDLLQASGQEVWHK